MHSPLPGMLARRLKFYLLNRGPRASKYGVFLTYGHEQGHMGGLEWNVLNKEGWGIIINRAEAWRYIGDVHLSKPHGSGVMSYTNQTKYAGAFVNGRRDGFGKIVDKDGNVMRGILIENAFAPQGVLVEVTVVNKDGIPVQYGKVAMNKYDSVRVQVDRIATVMGWELKQRFRLIPEGDTKVDVIGSMIDPKEPSCVETFPWDLDGTPKITAYIR
jgi:MORN repeat